MRLAPGLSHLAVTLSILSGFAVLAKDMALYASSCESTLEGNAYLSLLQLVLNGIDATENSAFTQINRNTLKQQLLQNISASRAPLEPIAELQKIASGLVAHSPQLVAIDAGFFNSIISSLSTDDWQTVRQSTAQKLAQMRGIKVAQGEAKKITEHAFVDVPDHNGDTRLHRLVREGRYEDARELVLRPEITSRYINQPNNKGELVFDIFNTKTASLIAQHRHVELRNALVEKEAITVAQLDSVNRDLLEAARQGDTAEILLLYKLGADLEFTKADPFNNPRGQFTALYIASANGHDESVKLLLQLGADLNFKEVHNGTEYSILMATSESPYAKPSTIQILLDAGAQLEEADPLYKYTPFLWAAKSGSSAVVKYLAQRGANTAARGANEETAMHLAAYDHSLFEIEPAESAPVEKIKLLAALGLDVNALDKNDETPLHYAVAFHSSHNLRRFTKIPLLYKLGAKLDAINKYGLTPLQFAKQRSLSDLTRILEHLENLESIKAFARKSWHAILQKFGQVHE